MRRSAVECGSYCPQPLDALSHLAETERGDLQECRLAARQVLSVPVGHHLRRDEVTQVAEALATAAGCLVGSGI